MARALEFTDTRSWCVSDHIICVLDDDTVKSINTRVPGIPVSEIVIVLAPDQQSTTLVVIRRVNEHSRTNPIRSLVKFTKRCDALPNATCVQLATPAYYRNGEELTPGIADLMEGCLTLDAPTWIASRCSSGMAVGSLSSIKSSITLASPVEPWVYCTSIYPETSREYRTLRAHFQKGGYDAATLINAPDTFAMHLAIDFTINSHKSKSVVANASYDWARLCSTVTCSLWEGSRPIENIVHMHHGPVIYENQSGRIKTLEDFANLPDWHRLCFTKEVDPYSIQREYRFALSTLKSPTEDVLGRLRFNVSDDLRALVESLS